MARRILNRKDSAPTSRPLNDANKRTKRLRKRRKAATRPGMKLKLETRGQRKRLRGRSPKKEEKTCGQGTQAQAYAHGQACADEGCLGRVQQLESMRGQVRIPQRKEAEEHAAKLSAAKNPPQPFFIQPLKEAMEEKKV